MKLKDLEGQILRVEGVRESNRRTSKIDARRIAIKATEEFLRENSGKEDINILSIKAMELERVVFESARGLNLTCEATTDEIRLMEDFKKYGFRSRRDAQGFALKLHPHNYPYEGFYIKITGKEEKENGGRKKRRENRRLGFGRRISKLSKGEPKHFIRLEERRSSLCKNRH